MESEATGESRQGVGLGKAGRARQHATLCVCHVTPMPGMRATQKAGTASVRPAPCHDIPPARQGVAIALLARVEFWAFSRKPPRLGRVTEAMLRVAIRDTLLVIPGRIPTNINITLRFIFKNSDLVEQERGLQEVERMKFLGFFSIPFSFLSIVCMIYTHLTMFNLQMSG
ncbi:hypothetical protein HAX54_027820 [Datura stramonium]|uniref:Uncharacterized protein n=1 Tax=Datura stramonium TaxID=4076 RepID=A0ABS8V392_DATST|nr:hypothetical protein [Datura stramonium]